MWSIFHRSYIMWRVVIFGEMIIDRVRILVHRVSYSVNNVFHFPFFFIPTEKTLLTE
jgi:hypothetical protein